MYSKKNIHDSIDPSSLYYSGYPNYKLYLVSFTHESFRWLSMV